MKEPGPLQKISKGPGPFVKKDALLSSAGSTKIKELFLFPLLNKHDYLSIIKLTLSFWRTIR